MCWIAVKQAGKKFDFRYMDKAQKHNEDGYGCAWYEDGFVKTYKTFDYKTFKGVVSALKKFTVVAHLRYATKGDKTYNNIHPFEVPSGVMFHNGTIFGLGDSSTSDSQELANTISECTYENIKDIQPLIKPYIDDKINRLVFFEDSGELTIMNKDLGVEEDGIWYSNDYHLKNEGWCRAGKCKTKVVDYDDDAEFEIPYMKLLDKKDVTTNTHKVFVYGTLMRGNSNNRLLSTATYLGKATTKNKWAMIGEGRAFPYLLEKRADIGKYVQGEVFVVNDATLRALDTLEGVPTHYKKETTSVYYNDTKDTELVNIYVKSYIPKGYEMVSKLINKWSA